MSFALESLETKFITVRLQLTKSRDTKAGGSTGKRDAGPVGSSVDIHDPLERQLEEQAIVRAQQEAKHLCASEEP